MGTIHTVITAKAVRQVLKKWHTADELGRHPLAELKIVQQRHAAGGHFESAVGYGLALKAVLNDAIETLRPDTAVAADQPEPDDKLWRPYLILTERYCQGQDADWIATSLYVAKRTLYREMRKGVERIVARLRHWEQAARAEAETAPDPTAAATADPAPTFIVPPLPPYQLVGRKKRLDELTTLLTEPLDGRFAAVHGLPGVGKTNLLLHLVHQPDIRQAFPDGIFWLAVGPQPDRYTILHRLAQQMGLVTVESSHTVDELVNLLRQAWIDKRALWVLDDVWAADAAVDLALAGTESRYILTTRHPEVALGLAGPHTRALPTLNDADGENLLAQFAPQVIAANPTSAEQLQQIVGGLPLALLIIGKQLQKAAYGGQTSRVQILMTRLQQREARMSLKANPVPGYQGSVSLATVIGLSIDRLSPAGRKALAALAVLPPKPNTIGHEAALTLADQNDEALYELVDDGLLEPMGADRYTIHPLIHDYALLDPAGALERDRLLPALLDHYAAYCADKAWDYVALDTDRDNLHTALDTAVQRREGRPLAEILFHYVPYLLKQGHPEPAARWVEKGNTIAQQQNDTVALAHLHACAGQLDQHHSRWSAAPARFADGLHLAERHGLERVALGCRLGQIETHLADGNPKAAHAVAQTILGRLDQHRHPHWRINAHQTISAIHYYLSDYAGARYHLQQVSALFAEVEATPTMRGLLHQRLGACTVELGRYHAAQTHYETALSMYQHADYRLGMAHVYNNMGVAALNLGRWPDAQENHHAALTIRRELDDHRIMQSLMNLMVLYLAQKNTAAAAPLYTEALALAEQHKNLLMQAKLLVNGSWLARQQADWPTSLRRGRRALALSGEIEHPLVQGLAHGQIALAEMGAAHFSAAEQAWPAAERIWHEIQQPPLATESYVYMAALALQTDRPQRAAHYLDRARPYLSRSIHGFEDTGEVLYICHAVCAANGRDDEAAQFKRQADAYIKQQSGRISDPAVRQQYLAAYQHMPAAYFAGKPDPSV